MASAAREEARKLQALPHKVRKDILDAIADALLARKAELLLANDMDLDAAEKEGVAMVLKNRLKLTDDKIATLAAGLRQLADLPDPLGVVKSKRELAEGMELSLITVPIGVLMIIFESRPDSMPQISALAIASGNGLLLKGGKEAANSNSAIHKVIGDAIEAGSNGAIKRDIIALVTSRGQVRMKSLYLRTAILLYCYTVILLYCYLFSSLSSSFRRLELGFGYACLRRCDRSRHSPRIQCPSLVH